MRSRHTGSSQIPPDLVVKTQAIDIVEIILRLLRLSDVVQTSWRNRTSRCELLASSETHWSTTKSDGMWKRPQRPLSSKGMQKKLERYAKAANIKASCHSLRHTFASNLLEEGAEVIAIKDLLGHASIQSSERYAQLSNQRVKQVYQQTMRKVIAKTRV